MRKITKYLGLVILIFIGLYGLSFLFSNAGLSPDDSSRIITGKLNDVDDKASSYKITESDIPNIKASSYEIFDLTDNQVIASKRPDSALLVASLTKLMTAWIVINYGHLGDYYQITDKDVKSFSPSLGLTVGDKVLVSDLFNAMLIGSANDAALTLSHYIESIQTKTFPDLMNSEAQTLKLVDTRFSNPNGFDSDTNYSSSNDLKILVEQLNSRHVFDYTSRANGYTFSGSLQKSYHINATNQLINKYSDLFAIKTGFTNEAQGSMINLLKTDQKQYLIIVLGSPDREGDTLLLREKLLTDKLGNR